MNIASFFINRPVFAIVLSITIILFGIVSFTQLGLREYPSVDPPIISVTTSYIGANVDVIETQITEPLEESINGIAGIKSISSTSSDGKSTITVEFELGVDMEDAANDVRDRVSRAIKNLPPDADPPIVVKADADSDAIIVLAIQSDTRNLMELTDIATNLFKERVQTIDGVSEVRIYGEKRYAMKILLNPLKLAAYMLSPKDIKNALTEQNVELPSGKIEGYEVDLSIRTLGRLSTEEDFNELIIKEYNGGVVRIKDVGVAKLLPENERTILRGNDIIPQVAIAIMPLPGSNHIAIAEEFYKRIEILKLEMPADINTQITQDSTVNIIKAVDEVQETVIIAFVLVVLVIFLFLRQWRTTFIPVITIPISLIGSFTIMYIAGFTINLLTLLGIVLATGLVVDDAIVVLENIYKKIEQGLPPKQAGHEGSKEIIFAVISTTITLVTVFLPIVFLQGLTGRLFREFAIVLSGAVLISAFVSLTLTPMLSARILKKSESESRLYLWGERIFDKINSKYTSMLTSFLRKRWFALIIVFASLAMILGFGSLLSSEIAPMEDKGRIRIIATAPEGTSFELMDSFMLQILPLIDSIPEKTGMIAVTSPGFGSSTTNSAFIRISLKDAAERTRTQDEIAKMLNKSFSKFTFAKIFASQEQTIGKTSGLPVQFVIQAPTFEKLKEVVPIFMEKAEASSVFQSVDINLKFNKPELRIEIDRDRAKTLGISIRDIAENLQLFYSGQRYGYFVKNSKQYQVIGLAERTFRDEPSDLLSIYVENDKGEFIQLKNVVTTSEYSSPPQLFRFNRYVSATISAQPSADLTIGDGIEEMQKIADEVLDEDFSTTLTGTSLEFAESSSAIMFAFLFALVLVYLVLAAQFESFRDPLTVMFTVPLAMAGAIVSLWAFGHTLNIFSQIGIIVLIGIVTKNGILIVEFANQRKKAGMNVKEAVIDAAASRFRPILMTSFATILGTVPIALALGSAAKSRVPMGVSIIGGLLFSLILTLFVVPAIYTYLSKELKDED